MYTVQSRLQITSIYSDQDPKYYLYIIPYPSSNESHNCLQLYQTKQTFYQARNPVIAN